MIIKDLPLAAQAVATILGVFSVFGPFLNQIGAAREITFKMPKLFGVTGSVAAFAAFVYAGFILRNRLHLILNSAYCFVVAVLALALLGGLAATVKKDAPRPVHVMIGLPLYALVTASILFGITKFAAENYIYWKLEGIVTQGGVSAREQDVALFDFSRQFFKGTSTNQNGRYQFLLTSVEVKNAAIVFAGKDAVPSRTGADWHVLNWDPQKNKELDQNLEVSK